MRQHPDMNEPPEAIELTIDELAQVVMALRIANILAARGALPREKFSNWPWEDLDEDEAEELGCLICLLNDRDATDRKFRVTKAIGDDFERDDLIGELAVRLGLRVIEE